MTSSQSPKVQDTQEVRARYIVPLLVLVVMLGSTFAAEWYFSKGIQTLFGEASDTYALLTFFLVSVIICGGTFVLLVRFAATRENYILRLSQLESELEAANTQINTRNERLESSATGQDKELGEKFHQLEQSRTAMVSLLEDLTQSRDEIEEARAFDEAILSSLSDGLVVLSPKEVIIRSNATAMRMNGTPNLDPVGMRCAEVFDIVNAYENPFTFQQRIADTITAGSKAKSILEPAQQVRTKDGRTIEVEIGISPVILNATLNALVILFRDVTEQRRIDRSKSEFVSLASHQLRTPLTAIGWYAELVLAEANSTLTAQELEYMHEIENANRRMINLVDSLLNVSRIEMGSISVQPELMDMASFIHTELTVFAPQIAAKNLSFVTNLPEGLPKYSADPKLMTILLQNLVSNSIKYSLPNGTIRVTLSYEGGVFVLKVADAGIGIPKADTGKIFQKLFRADNARLVDAEGSGLGLYLVKSIITHIGGDIALNSEEGKGTEFTIRFPAGGMVGQSGTKTVVPTAPPVGVVPVT